MKIEEDRKEAKVPKLSGNDMVRFDFSHHYSSNQFPSFRHTQFNYALPPLFILFFSFFFYFILLLFCLFFFSHIKKKKKRRKSFTATKSWYIETEWLVNNIFLFFWSTLI